MDVIRKFQKGSWFGKAKEIMNDSQKQNELLEKLKQYMEKKGLVSIKEQLVLMYNYFKDVITGKYKDYSLSDFIVIIAALIYLVSPIDLIPDFLPVGLIDDIAIIGWACHSVENELQKYKKQMCSKMGE